VRETVNLKQPDSRTPSTAPAWGRAEFVLAAHRLEQLPPDTGAEVAFAGRSNAGKSSAINAITGKAQLARISKTPGRTQQLVVFAFDPQRRLIDLPGYGYAEVSKTLREHWRAMLDRYFRDRRSLAGLLLAMDVRHPLTPFDRAMLAFCAARALPCHVLLTKADKLARGRALDTLRSVSKAVAELAPGSSAQLLSVPEKQGIDVARSTIARWLAAPPAPVQSS
jgi:GTP-binding protein